MSEMRWTLSELDLLHARVGLGAEWLASDARREIADRVTVRGEVVDPHAARLAAQRPTPAPTEESK